MAKRMPLAHVTTTNAAPNASTDRGSLENWFDRESVTKLHENGIEDLQQLLDLATFEDVRSLLLRSVPRFESTLERIVAEMPVAAAAAAEAVDETPRAYGAYLPPEVANAPAAPFSIMAAAATPVSGSLPVAVSLVSQMSVIVNQYTRSTCVAHALTAINEYVLRKAGTPQDLSEQHLHHETKQIDHINQAGTSQLAAAQVLAQVGQCHELTWPYNRNQPDNFNNVARPSLALFDAQRFRRSLVALQAGNVQQAKECLAGGRPVAMSVKVYPSWDIASTKLMGRFVRYAGQIPTNGHAMCAVGYKDDPSSPFGGYFIMRNSWGTDWAPQSPYGAGYGELSYEYVRTDCYEMYSLPANFTSAGSAVLSEVASSELTDGSQGDAPSRNITITLKPNVTGNVHIVIE